MRLSVAWGGVVGRVASGKRARISGRGFASGRVALNAFVPGISPYRAVSFRGRASRTGRFTLRWRTPRHLVDSLRWRVQATQGRRTASAYALITAAR